MVVVARARARARAHGRWGGAVGRGTADRVTLRWEEESGDSCAPRHLSLEVVAGAAAARRPLLSVVEKSGDPSPYAPRHTSLEVAGLRLLVGALRAQLAGGGGGNGGNGGNGGGGYLRSGNGAANTDEVPRRPYKTRRTRPQ